MYLFGLKFDPKIHSRNDFVCYLSCLIGFPRHSLQRRQDLGTSGFVSKVLWLQLVFVSRPGLPDSKKISIWVNFGMYNDGIFYGNLTILMLFRTFTVIWYIVWPCSNFIVIWYILPHFGTVFQEKSGIPVWDSNARALTFAGFQSVTLFEKRIKVENLKSF
jgi:hypothetical protein